MTCSRRAAPSRVLPCRTPLYPRPLRVRPRPVPVAARLLIRVALEPVVPAGEDRGAADVLREPALPRRLPHYIVVDPEVADVERPVHPAPPVLLDAHDAVRVPLHGVPGDLDVRGGRNQNPRAPEPRQEPKSIPPHHVPSDDCVVADLVKDPHPQVILRRVPLIKSADVLDVGPEAGAKVIMDPVIPHHQPVGPHELGPTSLPARVESRLV